MYEVGGNGIMAYIWPNRFGTSTMEDARMSRWEQEGYFREDVEEVTSKDWGWVSAAGDRKTEEDVDDLKTAAEGA
jgi:hypothetical protein